MSKETIVVTRTTMAQLEIPAPPEILLDAVTKEEVGIENLTDEQLKLVGELWTKGLLAFARKARARAQEAELIDAQREVARPTQKAAGPAKT